MTLALKQPHFRRAVFPLPALKQIEMREMTAQVSDTEKVRWLRIGGREHAIHSRYCTFPESLDYRAKYTTLRSLFETMMGCLST